MKKQESKTIYIFVLLIVVIGIASFVFRAKLVDTFLKYDYGATPTPVVNKSDELSLDLLREDKIKALKTNFSVFDSEDLNKTQDLLAEEFRAKADSMINTVINADGSVSVVKPVFFRVSVGNNNPFTVTEKPK